MYQLDGRWPSEQSVLGLPHLAHTPPAKKFGESVASHFPGASHVGSELVHDPRSDVRHERHHQIGEHETDKELRGRKRFDEWRAKTERKPHRDRHCHGGSQCGP